MELELWIWSGWKANRRVVWELSFARRSWKGLVGHDFTQYHVETSSPVGLTRVQASRVSLHLQKCGRGVSLLCKKFSKTCFSSPSSRCRSPLVQIVHKIHDRKRATPKLVLVLLRYYESSSYCIYFRLGPFPQIILDPVIIAVAVLCFYCSLPYFFLSFHLLSAIAALHFIFHPKINVMACALHTTNSETLRCGLCWDDVNDDDDSKSQPDLHNSLYTLPSCIDVSADGFPSSCSYVSMCRPEIDVNLCFLHWGCSNQNSLDLQKLEVCQSFMAFLSNDNKIKSHDRSLVW